MKSICADKSMCQLKDLTRFVTVPDSESDEVKKECNGPESLFFIQIGCVLPKDEISERQLLGLAISSMAVFIGLFVIVYFDYIK